MREFCIMLNIFACTSPNRSGFGAIDNHDRFEQVFDTYYIPETSEKNFMDQTYIPCFTEILLDTHITGVRRELNSLRSHFPA